MIRSALSLLTLVLITIAFSGVALAQSAPEFKLGFKALADQIPDVVGTPLENQHSGANGDALQLTTTGLMAWRKADNWTAFTDGSTTWINGPMEVQSRPNNQLFSWESPASPAPASPEVKQSQLSLSGWETYNRDGSVNGKFFTKGDTNNGLGSADKGFQLLGGMYNSYKNLGGESALGRPTSQEFQVNGVTYQNFDKGTVKFENGQGSLISKDSVPTPDTAKNTRPSPDTPMEVAQSDNSFNKTYTFGGGKLVFVNGPDQGLEVKNPQVIQNMLSVLNNPSSKMSSFTFAFPQINWNYRVVGPGRGEYDPDWNSWADFSKIRSQIPDDKYYQTVFGASFKYDSQGRVYGSEYARSWMVTPSKNGYIAQALFNPSIYTWGAKPLFGQFMILAQYGYRQGIMNYNYDQFIKDFGANTQEDWLNLKVDTNITR